jgi:hypothetical protein
MPMAFMDPEYPSWRAKEVLLDRCDLGDGLILGDSRAAADILPERMPFRMTNLAVGGGEAIEALAALTRVLQCPSLPKLVIISLDPGHFVYPDLFWERSVRYDFLSAADISNLRRRSFGIRGASRRGSAATASRLAISYPFPAVVFCQPDARQRVPPLDSQSANPDADTDFSGAVLFWY